MVAGCKSRGYIVVRVDLVLHQAHRLAWLYVHGSWPVDQIDHINCDPSDNRICNLREATPAQNQANTRSYAKSGFKGVRKNFSKWNAYIGGRTFKHLGSFDTPEEANAAYLTAARARSGEFARGE